MGAANVNFAFMWSDLGDKPMRVLLFMAVRSLDDDRETQSARVFWAGRETLAREALGREIPDDPGSSDLSAEAKAARKVRHAAFVAVQDALSALIAAGAITRLRAGRWGRQAEYRLNLDPFETVHKDAGCAVLEQAHPVPTNQAHPVPKEQAHPVPKGQADPVPEEQQRNNRGKPGGQPRLGEPSHLGATTAVHNAGEDEGYTKARATLEGAGPDRMGRALQTAREHLPEATTRDAVLYAAALVAGESPERPARGDGAVTPWAPERVSA